MIIRVPTYSRAPVGRNRASTARSLAGRSTRSLLRCRSAAPGGTTRPRPAGECPHRCKYGASPPPNIYKICAHFAQFPGAQRAPGKMKNCAKCRLLYNSAGECPRSCWYVPSRRAPGGTTRPRPALGGAKCPRARQLDYIQLPYNDCARGRSS